MNADQFRDKTYADPNSGCWLWLGGRRGEKYGVVYNGGKLTGAHRYSYELFKGPIPAGLFVCHKCDTPPCVNPNHLFVGTAQDNLRDAAAKGRIGTQTKPWICFRFGKTFPPEQHGRVKLTRDQAFEISRSAEPRKVLAQRYGVSYSLIYDVQIFGWGDIPGKRKRPRRIVMGKARTALANGAIP